MIYLSQFSFPTEEQETQFRFRLVRTCYDTLYPFFALSKHHLTELDFEPVTVLYGGNGSGKTTALNVIGEKLGLKRDTRYNRSNFFEDYTALCSYELCPAVHTAAGAHRSGRRSGGGLPPDSCIITSDDVFDFMLNIRALNEGVDRKREELLEEYVDVKYSNFRLQSLEDYEQLKKVNLARSKTQSRYVRGALADNIREHSNGESAFLYFSEKIKENALYLLDEPENSLSPKKQQELREFLENSSRFFGCQFIIATHSPFLLSMKGAKIYDMDEDPVDIKRWTELSNVREYYEFFKAHDREF